MEDWMGDYMASSWFDKGYSFEEYCEARLNDDVKDPYIFNEEDLEW